MFQRISSICSKFQRRELLGIRFHLTHHRVQLCTGQCVPAGGTPTCYFGHFATENCMKLKVITGKGREPCVPNAPLRSANVETEFRSRYFKFFRCCRQHARTFFLRRCWNQSGATCLPSSTVVTRLVAYNGDSWQLNLKKKKSSAFKKSNPKCVPGDSR